MKPALVALLASLVLAALVGCGDPKEKALETSAPKTDSNATTFKEGGKPKDVGAREPGTPGGPEGPAMKPEGT
jgi:predicted small lipoprotein YifL